VLASRPMNEQTIGGVARGVFAGAVLTLSLSLAACGGAVQSGVAVGRVGHGLSGYAHAVPQAAEVCALSEALAALPGSEKSISDACAKPARNDQLWRRVIGVLAAYGQALESMASGTGGDNAGRLEAAATGVSGGDWITVDGPTEQAARAAATGLVNTMSASGGDLGRTIKDAGPHVKTICEGLNAYLDLQIKGFGDVEKDAEKKRASRGDRRCGTVSGASVCVGESPVDRMVYANVFAQASLQESNHVEARGAVSGFCAAHRKAEEASADGRLGKDQTYLDIVDAVKAVQRAPAAGDAKAKPAKK